MKNRKGFTLVELLGVIVILTILSLLAIPAVTRYVMDSRIKSFVEDAKTIVSTSRSNYASEGYDLLNGVDESKKNRVIYSKEAIDSILVNKLGVSPFGDNYKDAGVIIHKVKDQQGSVSYEYYVCLIDEAGYGFDYTNEKDLSASKFDFTKKYTNCTGLPLDTHRVEVNVVKGSVDESVKIVYDGDDAVFNLTPSPDLPTPEASVSCTNNQNGTITDNVLTVSKVNASTLCTVIFNGSMTVLYADGTLILNEKPSDRSINIRKHGSVTATYRPFSNDYAYLFTISFTSTDPYSEYIINYPWVNERHLIKRVEIGQPMSPTGTNYWFYDLMNLESGNFENLDVSNVTKMYDMFFQAGSDSSVKSFVLTGLDNWDTSNVTTINSMFEYAGKNATTFDIGDLSKWNTSDMTDMRYAFQEAGKNATTFDIGNLNDWDTSKVTNMYGMFYYAGSAATTWNIGDLSNWNVSNVTSMTYMFNYTGTKADKWDIGNLNNWDVSKVTSMYYMFCGAGHDASDWNIGDISNWNVSNVTNMHSMLSFAGENDTSWSVGDLSNWNVGKVTDMGQMFWEAGYKATNFNLGNLNNWNVSNVTNMNRMFSSAGENATTWNVGNLNNWNVSNVTNMGSMFSYAGYDATTWSVGDLSNWNTSKVTNMKAMFDRTAYNSTKFKLNLSSWNVSNVTDMSYMFSESGFMSTVWNVGDLSNWNTSNVIYMSSMFRCTGHNTTTWSIGSLSSWNVSNVTNMGSMFYQAGFKSTIWGIGNLSNWDTSKVTNMKAMFWSAGENSTTWNSLGTFNVYATNIEFLFLSCGRSKVILNIYSNPTKYKSALGGAASYDGSSITVNYSKNTTNIDDIIATAGNPNHVTKGQLLD